MVVVCIVKMSHQFHDNSISLVKNTNLAVILSSMYSEILAISTPNLMVLSGISTFIANFPLKGTMASSIEILQQQLKSSLNLTTISLYRFLTLYIA